MVNAIPGRNLPLLNFCVPFAQTVDRSVYQSIHAFLFNNAPINVKAAGDGGGGGGQGIGWGFDCLCWPWGRAFD